MKTPYNGHESWNAWNVALWIGNDEGLYRFARECIHERKTLAEAAALFCANLDSMSPRISHTPDGARYSLRSVRLALEGLE